MDNPVRDYAWGSTTLLAEFLGREPSGAPEAELWMGAHVGDPSGLPDGRRLDDVLAEEAPRLLGPRVTEAFDDQLPYLVKVLAVDSPLSLQVHPSGELARLGHRREEGMGLDLAATERNYKDRSHKPEMVVALSRFEGLAGFREPQRTAQILRLLRLTYTDRVADRLEQEGAGALRPIVEELMGLEGRKLARMIADARDNARHAGTRAAREELRHRSHRKGDPSVNPEVARSFLTMADLAVAYPRDPGVLVTLLLNNVLLAPGEAMFLPAGMVHAYVSGLGLEIMASSDNVLRAGLTAKHVDVDEMLAVTAFAPTAPPRWEPVERTRTYQHFEPPVAEFCLTVAYLPVPRLPATGPRIVLALEGEIDVVTQAQRLTIRRGQSVFVGDDDGALALEGEGRVAVAAVPQ